MTAGRSLVWCGVIGDSRNKDQGQHAMKRWMPLLLLLAVAWGGLFEAKLALAKEAIVPTVLFYSPTCSHCAKLEREILPALQQRYGKQLVIVHVNVVSAAGSDIFEAAIARLKVPEARIRVPALLIGDTFLLGTVEIPEKAPGLIAAALAKGGLDWPNLPGLYEQFFAQKSIHLDHLSPWAFMTYKFKQDPLANGIAVLVLALLVISLIAAVVIPLSSRPAPKAMTLLPAWVIPPLAVIGLAVAVYLSYVEVSETNAFCGPVGHCNAVQNSPYAKLFGILPIAVLGMGGYIAILLAWMLQCLGRESLKRQGRLALWGLGLFSVLFSSYLTFLEPFVIGATCTFCLVSAVVLVMILWASILPAKASLGRMEPKGP